MTSWYSAFYFATLNYRSAIRQAYFYIFRVHCEYLKLKPRRGENEIRANKKLMGTMFLRNMFEFHQK